MRLTLGVTGRLPRLISLEILRDNGDNAEIDLLIFAIIGGRERWTWGNE